MIRSLLRRFLAFWRFDLDLVCELSRGGKEYHDYPDSLVGEPWHFFRHTCRRCGKSFTI